MTAGPSTQDDENRWPVTSGHGLGWFTSGTAARRSAATWNILGRLRMLFSREPPMPAGLAQQEDENAL